MYGGKLIKLVYNWVLVFRFVSRGCGYGFFVEVMGNNRNKEKCLRMIRGVGAERANSVKCQQHYRAARRKEA
jgi:hypothetical protein